MTSTPVISKGSNFVLTSGSVELKSIIIEDPTPAVGEAEQVSVTAHDGTKYTTTGSTGDNNIELTVLQTYEEFSTLMTYAYGTATTSGSTSTWSLATPSNTSGTISIITPKSGTNQITWNLQAAKALSVTPGVPIGSFATMRINVSGDNWQAKLNTNA